MPLRGIFLYLAASYGTRNPNNHDPEIGLEIRPEDTLEPTGDRNGADNDEEALNEENIRLNEEEADDVEADVTEDPLDLNSRRFRRFSSVQTAVTSFSKSLTLMDQPTWFQKAKCFVFPPKEDIESFTPNYRYIPIISGLLVPFSILLEIPGLTQHWYVRTENNQVIEQRENPVLLDVGLGVSLACAIIANLCLIMRFLEKRVKTMTILCVAFLTLHDLINIVTMIIFGVVHRFRDGFTYGQPFWMTVCSTAASTITNATLIWDLCRTPNFNKSGSGLTRKQRTLVIIIMVLFGYTCIGALINSILLKLSFIDGLYFTLVTIETIGFGDIVPKTPGSRAFVCAYSAIGFLNLGVAIVMCRETVLEAMDVAYRKRAAKVKAQWQEAKKWRHVEARWRRAIEWRLKAMGVPVWIRDKKWRGRGAGGGTQIVKNSGFLFTWAGFTNHKAGLSHSMHGPSGMRLNLDALTHAQLEASALEAGVSLDTLLPVDFLPAQRMSVHNTEANLAANSSMAPSWINQALASHFENVFRPTQACTLTHARLGGMSALLTRFAVATALTHAAAPDEPPNEGGSSNQNGDPINNAALSGETSKNPQAGQSQTGEMDQGRSHLDFKAIPERLSAYLGLETMQDLDKKAFYSKLIIAWSLFFVFWTIGSAVFMATEGWSYGISMYFCFVAFTSIGYGDYHPDTPAGRSIFVVWAILGVGTMTILISVIQDASGSRYQSATYTRVFSKAVKRYRQRTQRDLVSGRTGRRSYHRGRTFTQGDPSPRSQGKARSTSYSSSVFPSSQTRTDEIANVHREAQESLEALPNHVLRHAKIFHAYIRLVIDDTNTLYTHKGSSARVNGDVPDLSGHLRRLLDEIAGVGGIGRFTKEEILQDPQARHTLSVLTMEKALHQMIEEAEDVMDALQERDELVAQERRQQTEHNESDSEEDNGASSEVPEGIPEVSAQ
ncbi:hypothetical protein PILCRDRAFT_599929 [Piloderma croceum F 1598]|uniref:Potassium channel domain-containing protein n=1 Tax=Piloderma croceum (strain F 1598) TaxID=765440 RepID=A0A0C3BLM5_PILCF|nr:hypothetical protein PILCRDRAFT_599929 [Piloderma croceum F 1598]